ncbi:hypothetical protein D9M68_474320 [compost metagenome]
MADQHEHRIRRQHRAGGGDDQHARRAQRFREPGGQRLHEELDDRDREQAVEDHRAVQAERLRRVGQHEGIGEINAADGDGANPHAQQHRAPGRAHDFAGRDLQRLLARKHLGEIRRFAHADPDEITDRQQDGADEERYAPAPGQEIGLVQRGDQAEGHQREDQAGRASQLREGRRERAAALGRMLARHQHRATPFAAHRKALRQAQHQQQRGRQQAGLFVAGKQAYAHRGHAHDDQRGHQRVLAPDPVAQMAEHQPSQRPGQEPCRESAERRHRADERVRRREKHLAEDQRGRGGVDVEVVPLDGGADEGGGGGAHRLLGGGWMGGACHISSSECLCF